MSAVTHTSCGGIRAPFCRMIGGRISPRRFASSAFTLIELLVVISIIALLIAILLPALKAARTSAHMAASLSNLRQLSIVHHLYAGDNNGSLIRRAGTRINSAGNPNPTWPYWTWTLFHQGYITDVRVFWSPGRDLSAIDPARMQAGDTTSAVRPSWEQPGYGVNEWMMPFDDGHLTPARLGEADLPHSEVIMMAEAWQMNVSGRRAGTHTITATRSSSTIIGAPFTYNGAAARSYLDGHASSSSSLDIGWEAHDAYYGVWTYTTDAQIRGHVPWFRR